MDSYKFCKFKLSRKTASIFDKGKEKKKELIDYNVDRSYAPPFTDHQRLLQKKGVDQSVCEDICPLDERMNGYKGILHLIGQHD